MNSCCPKLLQCTKLRRSSLQAALDDLPVPIDSCPLAGTAFPPDSSLVKRTTTAVVRTEAWRKQWSPSGGISMPKIQLIFNRHDPCSII